MRKFLLAAFVAVVAVGCGNSEDLRVSQLVQACRSEGKVCICHVPPGNPSNAHEICIGQPAWQAHQKHGKSDLDYIGACQDKCYDRIVKTVCKVKRVCKPCKKGERDCGEKCRKCVTKRVCKRVVKWIEVPCEPTCDAGTCEPDAGPTCGDEVCNGDETCETCPSDCGECPPPPPVCGDEVCNGDETCETCPADCGVCPPTCGDQECNGDETCDTCPADCGECPPPPPFCGDETCDEGETCSNCAVDCGVCPPTCGDQECNGDETCSTCEQDCGACPPVCGDEECNGDETCSTCPVDCGECQPFCGDEECNDNESCLTCEADCGECPPPPPFCGDQECNATESCETCVEDCGECPPPPPVCGDETCDISETCDTCPADCGECPPPPPVCGDGNCDLTETCNDCALDCGACPPPPPACGDSTCNEGETCDNCVADCGQCPPPPSFCGDGTCDETETCLSCEADCGECLFDPVDPEEPELNIVGGGGCSVGSNGSNGLGLIFLILGAIVMVRFRKFLGLLAALLLIGGVSVADAAPPVNTLRSAPTSHDYFNTMRPETLDHLGVNARLNLRYDERPVRLVTRPGNDTVAHVIDGRIHMDVAVALGLFDRLEVGLLVPTTLYTNPGSSLDVLGVDGDYVKRGDIGDLRLVTKAQLLDYKWFDLSVALPITLPTGDTDRLTGENGFSVEPTLILGVSDDVFGISANVGYRARNAQDVVFGNQNVRFNDELTYGIGGRLTLLRNYDWVKTLDLVGDVWGAMSFEEQNQEEVPIEGQAGVRVHTTPGFLAGVSAGGGLTRGYGTPEFRVMATIGWDFGGPEPCPECKPRVVRETVEKVVTKVVEKIKVVDRIIVFPMVYFDTDKSDLRPDAIEALNEVVRILKKNENIRRIRLEGHCDRRASVAYNDDLAAARLASVLSYLADSGVSLERVGDIRVVGENLADQGAETADELQRDRRVEFKVLEVR